MLRKAQPLKHSGLSRIRKAFFEKKKGVSHETFWKERKISSVIKRKRKIRLIKDIEMWYYEEITCFYLKIIIFILS